MLKPFITFCVALACYSDAFATVADSSVSITTSKNEYNFIYNPTANRVEVKQVLNKVYSSNAYQVNLQVAEVYNNQVTIDDVTCKVDNHTPHNFKPEYSYYSVDDIFYSDEKICFFPVLLSKLGSEAAVSFKETATDPRYFTSVYFSEPYKVKQGVFTFKIPRWLKVDLKEMNFEKYHVSKTTSYDSHDDSDIITYTVANLPAMQQEPNSPGPSYIYPHLLILSKSANVSDHKFTYFGSVADQYAWYHSMAIHINTDKTVIAAKAKELTAGVTTDMDKIKAIFYYVRDDIRYLAFEDGLAGFKPEKADEVLRRKYGDCKGMANLTKELLASQGFDARLCWLGTDHIAYDYQTPSLAVDNHMICALIYQGKTIYLDATETYLGINDYAERIQGRQVLMENGDNFVLSRVPVAGPSQNFNYESNKLSVSGNDLVGNVKHLWKGEDKEAVLSGLNSIKKENSDAAIIGFLSDQNSDYTITDLKMTGDNNPDKDLTVNYKLDHKNAVSLFSKSFYVDLDYKKEFINSTIKLDERKNDFWFEYKTHLSNETELTIPANYKTANLPQALNIVNPDYEFHIQYTTTPGKLLYKKNILIKNTHLSARKFAQWNEDIRLLAKTYNESVILKPISE